MSEVSRVAKSPAGFGTGVSRISPVALRLVEGGRSATDDLIDRFASLYTPMTCRDYRTHLKSLFARTGTTAPHEVTEAQLMSWCTTRRDGSTAANNTIRTRITTLTSFATWCSEQGIACFDTEAALRRLRRSYPKTYGKVQSRNPARWLTRTEAYDVLAQAPGGDTDKALRDQLVIRLGLCGMRASEIGTLTIRETEGDTIRWTGKGRKPRTLTKGDNLRHLLDEYLRRYRSARPETTGDDVLICRIRRGGGPGSNSTGLDWGRGHRDPHEAIWQITTRVARQAQLGHVAPHDLRRSAAGILHRTVAESGAHHFDLLDIQRVLGHSDPATTMRSYLAPMDTDVLDRAAGVLD